MRCNIHLRPLAVHIFTNIVNPCIFAYVGKRLCHFTRKCNSVKALIGTYRRKYCVHSKAYANAITLARKATQAHTTTILFEKWSSSWIYGSSRIGTR